MNNIWTRIKIELKNFFFDNKGKFYCVVVAIGAILVIFSFVLNFIQINKKAKIELVDTCIDENGGTSTIDIKVRNMGDAVAYLYRVKVYILDSFQMKEIYYDACDEIKSDKELTDKSESVDLISIEPESDEPIQNETELKHDDEQNNSGSNIEEPIDIKDLDECDVPLLQVDSSGYYLIELSDEKEQEFNISQAVYSNDVDRFTLTLTNDGEQEDASSVKCIYMKIYYNEKDYVTTSKMVISLNADDIIYDKNVSEINLENARENYEILLKFNYYRDVIRSEKYELLLAGYEDNKNYFLNQCIK